MTDTAASVKIPIKPPKDMPVDLHVKAFIGSKQSVYVFISLIIAYIIYIYLSLVLC